MVRSLPPSIKFLVLIAVTIPELPPGFEPGLPESKSGVTTARLWELQKILLACGLEPQTFGS